MTPNDAATIAIAMVESCPNRWHPEMKSKYQRYGTKGDYAYQTMAPVENRQLKSNGKLDCSTCTIASLGYGVCRERRTA